MTTQEHLQQLSRILATVDHSAPSVSKYRELQLFLSDFTELEPQLIYPAYVSKAGNMSVRGTQSRRAQSASLLVFVVMRGDQDEEIHRAAREIANKENKPIVILQSSADDSWAPTYGLIPVGDIRAATVVSRIKNAFGEFEIERHPKNSRKPRPSPSSPPPQRTDPVKFITLPSRTTEVEPSGETFLLIPDTWDDFGYGTLFDLVYRDASNTSHAMGQVKIAHKEQTHGRPPLPQEFLHLDDNFFSLGQSAEYYEALTTPFGLRNIALASLRDLAFSDRDVTEFLRYEVTKKSLLRAVPLATVEGQFRRVAHGGVKVRDFLFQYSSPEIEELGRNSLDLRFEVFTNSQPPTNVHVLIGGNGVGKTTLLKGMSAAVSPGDTVEPGEQGSFIDLEPSDATGRDNFPFQNVIFVSFSAFDPFIARALPAEADGEQETLFSLRGPKVPISYIGLGDPETDDRRPRDIQSLAQEFASTVGEVVRNATLRDRWNRAIGTLERDPLFKDLDLRSPLHLENVHSPDTVLWTETDAKLLDAFTRASSGHKVVLLTLTRLVAEARERSLVLFDEPESHLHPPLLSSFMRALSDLLTETNGAAVIATHSPVVLQEVPKSCVWKLRRSGDRSVADRPQIETYGENVGLLTHEVFGLEVTQSGYHADLQRAVGQASSFEDVAADFGQQLGSEAQGIIRVLLAVKGSEGAQ
ncbi:MULTISPECIES: ATP-binding protein [unclassified Streptomyces]|uniref:ATP-binding protein n=1 Tax=unclassified Streptomyces TaxID=2593676 RepID=UPI00278C4A8C|nr:MULTISPECIES: ATP-binding protein [unclassified Streptomyces]